MDRTSVWSFITHESLPGYTTNSRSSFRSHSAACMDFVMDGASPYLNSRPYLRPRQITIKPRSAPVMLKHLFERESFPRRSQLGMGFQIGKYRLSHQAMQQSRIPEVNLRRFHLPLVHVLVPRCQLPHHECRAQDVQIPAHRRFGGAQRTPQFRA